MSMLPPAARESLSQHKVSGRPVRVCFVIDALSVAGTETQLLQLIRGLDRSRVVPLLCLLDGGNETSRRMEPSDCEVIRLGIRSLCRPATLLGAWRFARFLRTHKADVVQMHFPDSTYFAAPIARLAGMRHVLRTRRDLGFWMKPVDRWLGHAYNYLVTATVANCEACRQAVIAQEGAAAGSVMVMENGIDLERLEAIAAPPRPDDGRPWTIGMVANLRPVKGPDVFIRAAGMVAARLPNVRFRIGGVGDQEPAWRWIREQGLEDRFELPGGVADVPGFLAELDVAAITSHSEGLSNSVLEYMAAARPIVATAVGGNSELIEDGIHGLLVPPGNPEAVAGAIVRLLANPHFAAMLAAAARQRVRHRYSREAMVRRYENFYEGLVSDTEPVEGRRRGTQ